MKTARQLALLLILLAASARAANVTTYRPELEKLQSSLEHAVQEKLNLLSTREMPILVTLSLTERRPVANGDTGAAYDFPYGPMLPDERSQASIFDTPIDVEKVHATLFVPRDAPASLVQAASELTESALKRFRPVIAVSYWDRTDAAAGDKNAGVFHWEEALSRFALWAVPIAHILLLIVVLVLVQRRKHSARGGTKTPAARIAVKAPAGVDPRASVTLDERRHLQLITGFLREQPLLFLNTLEDEDRELRGLVGLLPHLAPEDHSQLAQLLGKGHLERLALSFSKADASPEFHAQWRAKFVGQLILRKLGGRSLVMEILGAEVELLRAFREATPDEIIATAHAVGSRSGWRIAAELVSRHALAEALGASPDAWPLLFASAEATPEEIRAAAREMGRQLAKRRKSGNAQENYAATKLLELTASVLSARDYAEHSPIIDALRSASPQLAELITRRLWTPEILPHLPPGWLGERLEALSEESLAHLLVTLPPPAVTAIRSAIRNRKKFAAAEARRRKLPKASPESHAFAREFLESLRARWVGPRLPPESAGDDSDRPSVKVAA